MNELEAGFTTLMEPPLPNEPVLVRMPNPRRALPPSPVARRVEPSVDSGVG